MSTIRFHLSFRSRDGCRNQEQLPEVQSLPRKQCQRFFFIFPNAQIVPTFFLELIRIVDSTPTLSPRSIKPECIPQIEGER